MDERTIHLIIALAIALLAGVSIYFVPDLNKDHASLFGTLSGFITIYAAIFAIIEVGRARSASQVAASEAKKAGERVRTLYDLRNLTECQICIEHALSGIDTDGFVAMSYLSRIVKLYTSELSEHYQDVESTVRKNIDMVRSYANLSKEIRNKSHGPLNDALLSMMADLSNRNSARAREEA